MQSFAGPDSNTACEMMTVKWPHSYCVLDDRLRRLSLILFSQRDNGRLAPPDPQWPSAKGCRSKATKGTGPAAGAGARRPLVNAYYAEQRSVANSPEKYRRVRLQRSLTSRR
ncbi:hypothetical protein EVAR_362_1 [Eumeta japonica]|uniref:Uncharacterized protein n=1 Tax=Eumeta variegata TaxID=151549 RepID=A0A4C1SCQ7_EUMVA|nr:hypothetical protein EVAR_362_1 [Eumeta japonica]